MPRGEVKMEQHIVEQITWEETEDALRSSFASKVYPVHKAGVYLYTTFSGEPMYVGKASDLEDRFADHLSKQEMNKELAKFLHTGTAKLYYAEVSEEEKRAGIELYLFSLLKPRYNNNTPSAKHSIVVNLPEKVEKWGQPVH